MSNGEYREEHYDSGKVRSTGIYIDDLIHGKYTYYSEDGYILKEMMFDYGNICGEYRFSSSNKMRSMYIIQDIILYGNDAIEKMSKDEKFLISIKYGGKWLP